MAEGELRTIQEDGVTTSEPIGADTFRSAEGRALLNSWAAQQEAWEDYCAARRAGHVDQQGED